MNESNETEAVTESTETSGSTRVPMEIFVETWEAVAHGPKPEGRTRVQEIAKRLGLKEASVQQRATKYRNPPTKRVVIDKATKKPVKIDGRVQYTEIPVGDRAVAIPLSAMPRGGGSKMDGQAGADLVAKLAKQRAEKSAI